jgi:hypothetical protein
MGFPVKETLCFGARFVPDGAPNWRAILNFLRANSARKKINHVPIPARA